MKGIIMVIAALAATSPCPPYSYETSGSIDKDSVSLHVKIQPDLGWKWNTKYPAKYQVKFWGESSPKRDFIDGELTMRWAWSKAETKPKSVTVVASFSICNESVCEVFRNQEFNIKVREQQNERGQ